MKFSKMLIENQGVCSTGFDKFICFSRKLSAVTIMDETSANVNNSDMKEQIRTNNHPYQWIQQDTNSAIIKLELETPNEAPPGKKHQVKCVFPYLCRKQVNQGKTLYHKIASVTYL